MARALLLFSLSVSGGTSAEEFSYVQYMEVINPLSDIDIYLGCVCLRWATADGEDRTLDIQQSLNDNHVVEGEYHGLVPFSSIESTVTVV